MVAAGTNYNLLHDSLSQTRYMMIQRTHHTKYTIVLLEGTIRRWPVTRSRLHRDTGYHHTLVSFNGRVPPQGGLEHAIIRYQDQKLHGTVLSYG
jgi:hypothetical protein